MCYAATVYVNFLFSFSTAAGLSLGLKIVVEIQWNSVFRSLKQRGFRFTAALYECYPHVLFSYQQGQAHGYKGK